MPQQAGSLAAHLAFVPRLLPPEPPVELGAEQQVLVQRAAAAVGRLDGAICRVS